MADGLNSIVTYLDANFGLLVLVALAYCLWREVGAAAVGGVGQFFVNAGSPSWHQTMGDSAQACSTVWYLTALVPTALFAMLPTALNEISRCRGQDRDTVDFAAFWSLFFAVGFANYSVLALTNTAGAADVVGGCFLLSVLFGGVAVTMGNLGNDRPGPQRAVASDFTSLAGDSSALCWPVEDSAQMPRLGECKDRRTSPTLKASPITPRSRPKVASLPRKVPDRARHSLASPAYLFNRNEFFIFRAGHLKDLEDLLRREPPGVLEGLQVAICRRLCRTPVEGDARGFVQAYVAQFRKRLEASYPAYFVADRLERAAA